MIHESRLLTPNYNVLTFCFGCFLLRAVYNKIQVTFSRYFYFVNFRESTKNLGIFEWFVYFQFVDQFSSGKMGARQLNMR